MNLDNKSLQIDEMAPAKSMIDSILCLYWDGGYLRMWVFRRITKC